MARKVMTFGQKWIRPQQGDRRDKRCAFVTKYDTDAEHARVTYRAWCEGCNYYICDKCRGLSGIFNSAPGACMEHDVMEHIVDDSFILDSLPA